MAKPPGSKSKLFKYENKAKKHFRLIIGLDEAGRGPLAGPVVAAGVALKSFQFHNKICDSKTISAKKREQAFHEILEKAYVGVGIISEEIIDSINILEATYLAMTNAVRHLVSKLPESLATQKNFDKTTYLLVDGNRFKTDLPYPYQTIIRGDSLSLSIACASIVAKVIRDRILTVYDQVFPEYGFDQHKGYPTVRHKQAIQQHGLSLIHRRTFHYV